jgi:hypothetical protein
MTSYRRINSRTINRDVQQQDNMVVFNTPISRAIYPNYFSVPDASNSCLLVSTGSQFSATAAPQLTFNGTALDVSGNVNASGNVAANGTILAQQFLAGQVINVAMLGSSDIPQGDVAVAVRAGPTTPTSTTLFTYSYTPKNATSYLLIEYQSIFDLSGSASTDSAQAGIFVANGQISYTYQNFDPSASVRTGMMLPIVGRYTNSSTAAKSIQVRISSLCDDVITVKGDTSTWLKITEIGR